MRHVAVTAALVATFLVQGCHRAPEVDRTSRIEKTPVADPMVAASRRAAGRWRSEPGILPGDKTLWVILDIAGTQDLRVERRGMSGRFETIYAYATGKVKVTPVGLSGEAPDADGSLQPFRSFSATFPSPAKMLVKSGDQTFVFRFNGV